MAIETTDSPTKGKTDNLPTPEEVRAANAGEYAPKGFRKRVVDFIKRVPVPIKIGGIALGATAIGAIAIHETIQARNEIPSTFDNSKDKGVVGDQNIVTVTSEEIKDLPSFNEKAQPFLLFPIKNIQPGQTINYEKNMSVVGWSKETLDMAITEGIKDYAVLPSVPIGTEFIAPIDGRVFVMTRSIDGETIPIGVTIEFMSPDNILYFMNIGLGVAPAIPYRAVAEKAVDVLTQAPYKGPENSNGREWEKGLLVERGTLLFRTTEQKDVDISIQGGINGRLENARIPGNVTFLTDSRSSQKLLVLK